ncbi:MAG: hypothetical protein AMXMBFR23_17130 [Chloroflexota bacterium]
MRRLSILGLATVIGWLALAPPARAQALRTPEVDYCTASPDVPLGWWFNDACRGHDECLAPLAGMPDAEGRARCDRGFFSDLLAAPHVLSGGECRRDGACARIAYIYFAVVRFTSRLVDASLAAPSGLPPR